MALVAADSPSGLADQHYRRLRDELLAGRFPPGSVLLETALAERYGVSRTPMREALGRLAQDGYIERSGRGFTVRVRTPEEIMNLYDTRIVLESDLARRAAERRTDFDLRKLEHVLDERRECSDRTQFAALNDRWHRTLRAVARNDVAERILTQLDGLIIIYRLPSWDVSVEDPSVEEHGAVLEAVAARDGALAHERMTAHLQRMQRLRLEALVRA